MAILQVPFAGAEDNEKANDQRGVYFSKKKYNPEPLPQYSAVKKDLPEPVLDDHPEYIEMYWKCWEICYQKLRAPEQGSPLVSNWVDEAFSGNIFQWDTIFMMMFTRYGHDYIPGIQSLDNFYAMQRPSGYICREIRESDGREIHFDFDGGLFSHVGRKNTINPPLFSWAELESFKVTGDKKRFKMVLPVLENYVKWLNRDGDPDAKDWENNGRRSATSAHKLYWNTPLGSGLDNTPKPTKKGAGWVDMSCQMVIQYNNLSTICKELGKTSKSRKYALEAKKIAKRINKWCWDKEDGIYYDVLSDGTHFKKKTALAFWPMVSGVASKEQAARLVKHLKDPKEFWRPIVFPTLAADEKEYQKHGDYWKGGVWAPTNYAIIKGLEKYGYNDFAAESTEKYLDGMAHVFKKTGTVWENYSPEYMEPGQPAKGDFVGWTGCGPIALLIENSLGFRPDGVRNTLTWHLRRTDRHGIKKLRFGDVRVSLICEKREKRNSTAKITVESNKKFTLILYRGNEKRVFKIKAGKQAFLYEN